MMTEAGNLETHFVHNEQDVPVDERSTLIQTTTNGHKTEEEQSSSSMDSNQQGYGIFIFIYK